MSSQQYEVGQRVVDEELGSGEIVELTTHGAWVRFEGSAEKFWFSSEELRGES